MANIAGIKVFTFRLNAALGEGYQLGGGLITVGAEVNVWLASVGNITITRVDVLRRTMLSRAWEVQVAISYVQGPAPVGGMGFVAFVCQGHTPSAQSLDFTQIQSLTRSAEMDLAAQFEQGYNYATGTPLLCRFVVEIGERADSAALGRAYLVLASVHVDSGANLGWRQFGNANQTFFAVPTADIAPGGTATCQILDSFRTGCGVWPVTNVGTTVWKAFEYNYTVQCPLTGVWIGTAPCQSAPPLPPVRAYRAGPFPRVEGATLADEAAMSVAYRALPYTPVP